MEPRKVIKFGTSSYVVTLPFEWVKKNNLDKGNNIFVTENNDTLIFSLNKEKHEKQAEINLDDMPLKLFNRKLISYYLKNFKYIKIAGNNVIEKLEEIRVLKEKLSSIEIVEINQNYIVLKDLTSPNELNISKIISEIVDMEKILFDELSNEKKGNKSYLISSLDTNINKLSFLAYKAINYNLDALQNQSYVRDAIHYHRIVSSFENIGDILKRIARYLKDVDAENNHHISLQIIALKEYFVFITNFLQKDINLENNLKLHLDKKQSLLREFENMRAKFGDDINLFLVINQLLKDILGQLDTVLISVIDINCK